MNKVTKIYIVVFFVLMLGLVANDASQPKPIDWSNTFSTQHKKPFGLYVFSREIKNLFPDAYIENIKQSPYLFLKEELGYDIENTDESYENATVTEIYNQEAEYTDSTYVDSDNYTNDTIVEQSEDTVIDNTENDDYVMNYLFVAKDINLDDTSAEYLLTFVAEGNTAFISSHSFPEMLLDTLQTELKYDYYAPVELNDSTGIKGITKPEEYTFTLANSNIDNQEYKFDKGVESIYFSELDSATTTVLGYQKLRKVKKINFIKVAYGNGFFYLHTQPHAFTNYYLLGKSSQYAASVLSYITADDIYFNVQNDANYQTTDNALRFVFSQPTLKKAWLLAIVGIVIFMIFKAKRKQRIIPIIEKLPNTSIQFAQTIGNLYFQEQQPEALVRKKILFFLEYVRNTYLLNTQNLNDDFKKKLQSKTGIPQIEINRLVDYIIKLNNKKDIKESYLVLLHQMLENFYQKSKL